MKRLIALGVFNLLAGCLPWGLWAAPTFSDAKWSILANDASIGGVLSSDVYAMAADRSGNLYISSGIMGYTTPSKWDGSR
jgi:hypothetical protein